MLDFLKEFFLLTYFHKQIVTMLKDYDINKKGWKKCLSLKCHVLKETCFKDEVTQFL